MKLSYHLTCVLLLGTSGCVVEATDDGHNAVGQEDSTEETGTASDAIQATAEVKWSQGQTAIGLGPTGDRVCLLTGMGGNFVGGGERVQVYGSGGSWYLGGTSLQTGVAGWASCAYTPYYSNEYSWEVGQAYPTPMGSAAGRVCFITRVAGGFNGTKEWVHAYQESGQWFLTGGSSGPFVKVFARCASSVSWYSSEVGWNSNDAVSAYVGPSAGYSCGVTRIAGKFDSGSDFVRCDRTTDSWYLTGKGTSGLVGIRARLF